MDKNKDYNEYLILDNSMVDISGAEFSGEPENKRKKKKQSNSRKVAVVCCCIAAVVVLGAGIAGFCLLNGGDILPQGENEEFKFSEGVSVSGVSISGKTMDQAREELEKNSDKLIPKVDISVDCDGEITSLSGKDFKYTYNIDEVLLAAKYDFENPPKDFTVAPDAYTVSATVSEQSIDDVVKQLKEKTDKEPKNASVSKFTPFAEDRFEYAEAESGKILNADDLKKQISAVFERKDEQCRIIADVETKEAKISVDDIKKNVKKLSTYETVSYNTENGTSNMKVSLEACNGSVIEPGATWSFNKCTGDSNLTSLGYKPAGVIINGELTDGIGGGICQSSSTIYNAAIRANMDVEERYCHKWASSYVPAGTDATIDYPNLDLKLSNPTDYQMFMECKLNDRTLSVTIWGAKSSSYDYIKVHNELAEKNKDDYKVKAWRIYIKGDEEVEREALSSSTYSSDHGYVFTSADNDSNAKKITEDEKPKPTEPEKTEPTTTKPKPTEPATTKPKPTEPATTKPKPTQPATTKPKPTQPVTEKPTQPATDPLETEANED